MIGYSDSNKDAGLASARWALQEAQIDLVRLVNEKGIELNLFHGRGGTISRNTACAASRCARSSKRLDL